jgi:purine-binding chemotaxis protein CheW
MNTALSELYVLFRVGAGNYVLPASTVLEMETFTGATPIPGAPPHVAGLVQIRGKVIAVVDLRARFGMPAAELALDNRVVVIDHAGRRVGLLVDSAREVAQLAADAFRPPPEVVAEQARGFVKAVAEVDKRLVMLLDPSHVLTQEDANVEQRQV